jgi:hypothetical protein
MTTPLKHRSVKPWMCALGSGFGLIAAWADLATADETAFQVYCGKCHGRAGALARSFKGKTPEERSAASEQIP